MNYFSYFIECSSVHVVLFSRHLNLFPPQFHPTPVPITIHCPSPLPYPLAATNLLLSLQIGWFCIFHMNGIAQYWSFVSDFFNLACFWGSSVLIVFTGSYSLLYGYTTFCCWWTFGLSPPFSYCERQCYEHSCTGFCLNTCFQFFWVHIEE